MAISQSKAIIVKVLYSHIAVKVNAFSDCEICDSIELRVTASKAGTVPKGGTENAFAEVPMTWRNHNVHCTMAYRMSCPIERFFKLCEDPSQRDSGIIRVVL